MSLSYTNRTGLPFLLFLIPFEIFSTKLIPTSWSKSISASLVILNTWASNLLNLKCEKIMGKLNLTISSNKIIDLVPGAEGKITKRPIDLEGISIKANFS